MLRDEELEAERLRAWAPLRGAKEAEEEPRGPPTPLLLNNAMDGDWCNVTTHALDLGVGARGG
jgi:hypothetical protein